MRCRCAPRVLGSGFWRWREAQWTRRLKSPVSADTKRLYRRASIASTSRTTDQDLDATRAAPGVHGSRRAAGAVSRSGPTISDYTTDVMFIVVPIAFVCTRRPVLSLLPARHSRASYSASIRRPPCELLLAAAGAVGCTRGLLLNVMLWLPPKPLLPLAPNLGRLSAKCAGIVERSGAIAGGGDGTGGGAGGRFGPTACQSVGCGRVCGGGM